MTMTLDKLRDDLREWQASSHKDRFQYPENKCAPGEYEFSDWADTIDAHLAGMSEPVGEVFGAKAVSTMVALWKPLSPGTKLYAAPPASGDWSKVREVIAILDADGDEWGCAAMLTAALPENAK